MPNWCYTSYVATGDSKEVYDLYKKMKSLEDREESLVPNGFGKSWLGNLVSLLGGDWQKVACRGDWNNLNISNDCSELRFNTESAWAEPYEVIEFLKGHYPNIHFYFQAEEDGCEYWVEIEKLANKLKESSTREAIATQELAKMRKQAENAEKKLQQMIDDTPARGKDGRYVKRDE